MAGRLYYEQNEAKKRERREVKGEGVKGEVEIVVVVDRGKQGDDDDDGKIRWTALPAARDVLIGRR